MKPRSIILVILILLWTMSYELWTPPAQASIVLKTMVVNPSQTKTQTAVLKAYLPKEAKPEDVAELGDLKIDYDVEKGLYYVYKEFELAPGESASRSVEIKDIWVISRAELEILTVEAKNIIEKLKKTSYFDAAIVLQKDIEEKADEVLAKQERAMEALPQTHIAVYRDNMKTFDSIKDNLSKLDEMLIKVKVTGSEHEEAERISVKATWWLILAVIISLGLLSFVFYIIWQRQATIVEKKEKEEDSEKVS